MPDHVRWWIASIVFLVAASLVSVWLEGDAAKVATTVLNLGMIACAVIGFFSWFRWTQARAAVTSPVEPTRVARGDRPGSGLEVVALFVLLVVSFVLKMNAADASWFRPVVTLVILGNGALLIRIANGMLQSSRPMKEREEEGSN